MEGTVSGGDGWDPDAVSARQNPDHMGEGEEVVFEEREVTVTSQRVVSSGTSHALTPSTSVKKHRSLQAYSSESPVSNIGKIVLVVGLIAAFAGAVVGKDAATPLGQRFPSMVPGFLLAMVGVFMSRLVEQRTIVRHHAILFDHAHADLRVATSTDEAFIDRVVDAIDGVIAAIPDWQDEREVEIDEDRMEELKAKALERAERHLQQHEKEAAEEGEG